MDIVNSHFPLFLPPSPQFFKPETQVTRVSTILLSPLSASSSRKFQGNHTSHSSINKPLPNLPPSLAQTPNFAKRSTTHSVRQISTTHSSKPPPVESVPLDIGNMTTRRRRQIDRMIITPRNPHNYSPDRPHDFYERNNYARSSVNDVLGNIKDSHGNSTRDLDEFFARPVQGDNDGNGKARRACNICS